MKTVLAALLVATGLATPASANPLASLQWEKRIVLMFSPSRSLATLDRQEDDFRERRPDLKDRDIDVFTIAGSSPVQDAIGYTRLPSGANRDLRRLYEPFRTGLTIVLIGRDGTEKQRWNKHVDVDEIFALIDTMPMRQREMREDGIEG